MELQKEKNLVEASSAGSTESSFAKYPKALPEQFLDEKTGQVKLEELVRAYNDLAARDDNLSLIHI